jgi:mgtE-like transporter
MKLANIRRHFTNFLSLGYLKEGIIALSFNVGGILAGFIVASQFSVFQLVPWALALYPVILSARGVISGIFSGRLSTALHLGTIDSRLRGNTDEFYLLIKSIIVLTLETSLIMSFFSAVIGFTFWGITIFDTINILIVVSSTMFLGLINSIITILFATLSFRKGLDTDVVLYPIMSTVADITMTLFYVLILSLFLLFGFAGKIIVISLVMFLVALASVFFFRYYRNKFFAKTIKESILTLLLVAVIVNITGTILRDIDKIVGGRKEVYTVYPALIDTVGDVGSVIGATATTKFALGLFAPSFRSILGHAKRILATWFASVFMFGIYAVISLVAEGLLTVNAFVAFFSLLFTVNVIAVSIITIISFTTGYLTYKRGLDPDNFVIPIESSLADSITTGALLFALFLISYTI